MSIPVPQWRSGCSRARAAACSRKRRLFDVDRAAASSSSTSTSSRASDPGRHERQPCSATQPGRECQVTGRRLTRDRNRRHERRQQARHRAAESPYDGPGQTLSFTTWATQAGWPSSTTAATRSTSSTSSTTQPNSLAIGSLATFRAPDIVLDAQHAIRPETIGGIGSRSPHTRSGCRSSRELRGAPARPTGAYSPTAQSGHGQFARSAHGHDRGYGLMTSTRMEPGVQRAWRPGHYRRLQPRP